MKVLVTGGHGFIGMGAVASLSSQGHEVVVPKHSEFDLLDPAARQTLLKSAHPDALVHLAWQTKHGVFWTAEDNIEWREATMSLLREFLEQGGSRAVLAGTCAEYDWQTGAKTFSEDAPCSPATLYGQCKYETFKACRSLVEEGASIAWGRLFFLLGPRETPTRFMPSIIRPLLAGETAPMGSGSDIRDFMHCDDAGKAFAALATSNVTGAVNIASGTGVRLADVALMAASRISRGSLDIGALPARPHEPESLIADVTRLTDEVEFSPSHTLESAIDDCIAYWRTQDEVGEQTS